MTDSRAVDPSRFEHGSGRRHAVLLGLAAFLWAFPAVGAETVPTDAQLPGTQPGEVSGIQSVSKCDNCHGNFEPAGEPWFNWAGSMMAQASRDPLFWAAVAVAEQDFDGSGDLCLRCHVPEGWLDGRSTPTDGSSLAPGDADGVQCDVCHRLTNPGGTEHAGVQNPPFVAHDGGAPPEPFFGTGMMVLSDGNAKLGPYSDAEATHQFEQSLLHRDSGLCGTCHDVSNPVVGDLAHNNGAQTPLPPGSFSGVPGAPVDDKAAFQNPPYSYGVVERTFSEHQASAFSTLLVSQIGSLPAELQAGSIQDAWQAAQLAGTGGNYEDTTPRAFSCQSCHMPPTVGQGCNKNPPLRGDLPVHDLTGGNIWVPDAITYFDDRGWLVLGGGLGTNVRNALTAGKVRAQQMLDSAAALTVSGNEARVVNLTGHKLITGYPEGRRMWLEIEWRDVLDAVIAVDGEYGPIDVDIGGAAATVDSLVDLHTPWTRVYEAHGAMTQEWAGQLLALGKPAALPLAFDRNTGAVTLTLGDLGGFPSGTAAETFHFVLNNTVAKDSRIPPYGMDHAKAVERNIVPVPAARYGPEPDGTYRYWDTVALNPPPGAASATLRLRYQTTSWEYIQFLAQANDGSVAFLADEGNHILDAWQGTGMAAPYTLATATWSPTLAACSDGVDNDLDGEVDHVDDPGCSSALDVSESDSSLPCDDRIDNDGDGLRDVAGDPGCLGPAWTAENPQCSDGVDNDFDGKIDWDGGGAGDPDPQCVDQPWKTSEKGKRRCGSGPELVLLALVGAARLRKRAR